MQRRILIVEVAVALDPVPGTFHDPEDTVITLQHILDSSIKHYNPVVKFLDVV